MFFRGWLLGFGVGVVATLWVVVLRPRRKNWLDRTREAGL
jgi:hypothetical protein